MTCVLMTVSRSLCRRMQPWLETSSRECGVARSSTVPRILLIHQTSTPQFCATKAPPQNMLVTRIEGTKPREADSWIQSRSELIPLDQPRHWIGCSTRFIKQLLNSAFSFFQYHLQVPHPHYCSLSSKSVEQVCPAFVPADGRQTALLWSWLWQRRTSLSSLL